MKKLFSILIVLWIIIAAFNTFYNVAKSYSEYREWGSLTDAEKRHKLVGDTYDFVMLIKNHTNARNSVLIYTTDRRIISLSMYYLYPQRDLTTDNKSQFLSLVKSNVYDYIATYDDSVSFTNYKKIASYKSKDTNNFGLVYKKQ